MKRTLTIALLVVMAVMCLATASYATTSAELADKLYEKGQAYGMTSADKVKIERYLSEYPVTDEEANSILAKADEAIAVMNKAGVKDYFDLTKAQKSEIKNIAKEAAEIIDVQLVFSTGKVEVVKDGKIIETITNNDGKLAYTGNSVNIVLAVVATVAVIALAVAAVSRRKVANA